MNNKQVIEDHLLMNWTMRAMTIAPSYRIFLVAEIAELWRRYKGGQDPLTAMTEVLRDFQGV